MSLRHLLWVMMIGMSLSLVACGRKTTEVTGDMEKAKKEKFPDQPGKGGGPGKPPR